MQQAVKEHEQKLQIHKSVQGGITYLRFVGIVDENFDARACAKGLAGQLIVSLAEIRRITSFGIRQWMDFIQHASATCSAIYFVECAPRIVDQLNMVDSFAGKATVVSFYAPFRCTQCGEESQTLVQVDQSRELLASRRISADPCPKDGASQTFDDDPDVFLSFIAEQPEFELDPKIATFLATRTRYTMPEGLRRIRVEKKVHDRFTFLGLSGDLGEEFPTQKIAEGLEGDIVFDLAAVGRVSEGGQERWGDLLATIAPVTERIIILGLPAMMLETLSRERDLADKAQVLSVYLAFACKSCSVTAMLEVDVAKHFEFLRLSTVPESRCPDCSSPVSCVATTQMLAHLADLPQPASDLELSQLAEWSRAPAHPAADEDTTAPGIPLLLPGAHPPSARGRTLTLVVALFAVFALAGAIYALRRPGGRSAQDPMEKTAKLIEASHPKPPAWRDQAFALKGDQVLVTGTSSFVIDKEEGFKEARAASLETLSYHVATSIHDPAWVEHVGDSFQAFRAKALQDLEKALMAGEPEAIHRARNHVLEARQRVAKSLLENVGAILQPDRGEFYWEKLTTTEGIRYRVWLVTRLAKDEFRRLAEHYGRREEALSATAMAMFPGMAWRYGYGTGAVVVGLKPDSPLRYVGLLSGDIIVAAQDRTVKDAATFRRVLTEEHAELRRTGGFMLLKVQRGDGPLVEHRLQVSKEVAAPPVGTRVGTKKATGAGGKGRKLPPANIWDDNPFE